MGLQVTFEAPLDYIIHIFKKITFYCYTILDPFLQKMLQKTYKINRNIKQNKEFNAVIKTQFGLASECW